MLTKLDQFPNLAQGEAQALHLTDESKALDGVIRVQPESARTASCFGQELVPLVESDCIDRQGRALGDFSDLYGRGLDVVVCRHDKIMQSGV